MTDHNGITFVPLLPLGGVGLAIARGAAQVEEVEAELRAGLGDAYVEEVRRLALTTTLSFGQAVARVLATGIERREAE